jgi:hypothetical protein
MPVCHSHDFRSLTLVLVCFPDLGAFLFDGAKLPPMMASSTSIKYRSELPAAPSGAGPGRHVAWRALGLGGQGFPLLVCQVTFMAPV